MSDFQDELQFISEVFWFLFIDFGYKISYTKETRKDHYCIGLTSDSSTLRIKFERELAPRWGVFIGNGLSFDGPLGKWIPVEKALTSLNVYVDYSELREKKYYEQVRGSLHILANAIKPVFSDLKNLPLP